MPDNSPEVKVRLTAEDQGVSAAIRQLGQELKNLKTQQEDTASSSRRATGEISAGFAGIKQAAIQMGQALKDGIPGLRDLTGTASKFGSAALSIGGPAGMAAAAIVGIGAAGIAVTGEMFDLAQSIENAAAATGLSRTQVQEYNEVAKEMNVDAQALQMAFARIQTQLGQYIATGDAAGSHSQRFVQILKELQVSLVDTHGALRPVNDILGDFSDALAKIPDAGTRAALEMAALGPRGRVLAQVMEEAARQGMSLRDVLASIDKSGNVIPDSELDSLMESKRRWDELTRSIRGAMTELKGFIATAVTHPIKGAAAIGLGTAAGPEAANAFLMGSTAKPAGPKDDPQAAHNAVLIGQIAEQNEKLSERVEVLKAGGETQLQLQQAEASYSVALKSHNAELAKQYGEQISQLKSILSLEAAKKKPKAEGAPPLLDAAAKAQLAFSLKQQQDELSIFKAGAAQREEIDKEEYERGTISIAKYFADRRAIVEEETAREIAALKKERDEVQAAANLAGERAATAQGAIPTARSPEEKRELASQADRQTAEQLQGLARVDELETRITEKEIGSRTAITQLDAEQFKTEEEGKKKILEFLKEIDQLQHKRPEGAKDETAAKSEEMRTLLGQFKGQTIGGFSIDTKSIDDFIAKFQQLSAAEAQFSAQQKATQEGIRTVENQRRDIEIQLKDGKLLEGQAEQGIKALLDQELPVLRQKAQLELETAKGSGDEERIEQAQLALLQVQQLGDQLEGLGAKMSPFHEMVTQDIDEISTHLTTGLNGWIEGHERFGQAVAKTWNSIVMGALTSLEKIGAQFISQHLKMLLFKQTTDQAQTASTAATSAEGQAILHTAGATSVLEAAKVAAVHAFKSVWETVPFPLNLVLAPVVAAGAFAGALAFGAFAEGGSVAGRVKGPGGPTDDRVPAMLSAGEYVVKAAAVKSFGEKNLEAINSGRFSEGGAVMPGMSMSHHVASHHVSTPHVSSAPSAFSSGGPVKYPSVHAGLRAGLAAGGAVYPENFDAAQFARDAAPGAIASSITRPSDFAAPSFKLPAELGGEAGAPGGTHFNFPTHIGELSALDGASVRSLLEQHGDLVGSIAVAAVKRHFRTNGVGG